MMGPGSDMFDPIFGQLFFEPGGAPPVGVLPTVVGEHLFGNTIFANGLSIRLDHVFSRLAAVKPHGCDIAAVVIDVADQIGIFTRQSEGHDIALPHLVRCSPFKKSWLGRILFAFLFDWLG